MSHNLYLIVEAVADRFKLSPFEIMDNRYIDEVIDLWTRAIISAQDNKKEKRKGGGSEETEERVRVTSKTATWH